MTLLRTLALTASLALALAACAAPASQDPKGAQVTDAQVEPAPPSTRPIRHLRTGGRNPPQKIDASCAVDADCTTKPHCVGEECRCVRNQCIVLREALDPVIDYPATPATSVR